MKEDIKNSVNRQFEKKIIKKEIKRRKTAKGRNCGKVEKTKVLCTI